MKKITKYLVSILFLFIPVIANASSASITVSATNKVVVGNIVNVTVKLSAGESWDMMLDYDSSHLQFVGGGGESGGVKMANTSTGNPSRSYTFKFKALKSGSATVKISSYDVVDGDFSQMSVSAGSKTISIITQAELEASYSKINDLSSLGIDGYEISPAFAKDTLEYSVTVPEDVTEVTINATAADSKATVTGSGVMQVELGMNKFEIVCKAENGSEKTYTLNVEVKDSNPIEVKVDNQNLTLVKVAKSLTKPASYEDTTITIDNVEVPGFKSDVTKLTLVGLKDEDGNVSLYTYNDGKYEKYVELTFGNITIYVKDTDKTVSGYTKKDCTIQDNDIACYTTKNSKRYKLIYGTNVETNEEGFYLYDTTDKTLIKYDTEYYSALNQKANLLLYSTIALGVSTFISLIIIISLIKKKKKVKNKYPKVTEVTYEDEDNSVAEEKEISEVEKTVEEEIEEENSIAEIDNQEEEEFDDSFLTEKEKKKRKKHK